MPRCAFVAHTASYAAAASRHTAYDSQAACIILCIVFWPASQPLRRTATAIRYITPAFIFLASISLRRLSRRHNGRAAAAHCGPEAAAAARPVRQYFIFHEVRRPANTPIDTLYAAFQQIARQSRLDASHGCRLSAFICTPTRAVPPPKATPLHTLSFYAFAASRQQPLAMSLVEPPALSDGCAIVATAA